LATERRLETTAQACIDIAHRILAIEGRAGLRTSAESILELADLDILPRDFARSFAGIAGFRNVLAHMYIELDWRLVYQNLQQWEQIERYADYVRAWLRDRPNSP